MRIPQHPTIPMHQRKLAAASYIPLFGMVVWYGHRENPFIAYHAVQGSMLGLYMIVAYYIPAFGPFLALMFAAVATSGFIHALAGKDFAIPFLSDAARWIGKYNA